MAGGERTRSGTEPYLCYSQGSPCLLLGLSDCSSLWDIRRSTNLVVAGRVMVVKTLKRGSTDLLYWTDIISLGMGCLDFQ